MTEPFLVPESPYDGAHLRNLFRQEVERFARELPMMLTRTQREWITAYLAARFPEAAPETPVRQLHPYNADGSVGHNIRCEGCGCVTADDGKHVCFESCVINELEAMERPKPTPSAPAEPVDTRCPVFGNLGRCMLDVDHPGGHQFYTIAPLADARPKAGKDPYGTSQAEQELPRQRAATVALKAKLDCTACPCARCAAERDFRRAHAAYLVAKDDGSSSSEWATAYSVLVAAARKVVTP